MRTFYKGCAKAMLMCAVLFVSFLFTTFACDVLARSLGYYEEGIRESNEARLGQ